MNKMAIFKIIWGLLKVINRKQKKILLIAIGLILCSCANSQPLKVESFKLFDYSTILDDLVKNGNKSKYYEYLDYESMLYLDRTSFRVLRTANPDFIEERNIDTTNIFFEVPESYVRELPVNFTSIEQLFSNNDTLKNTILRLNNVNLNERSGLIIQNNIYIKDHQKAIVTIHVNSWSITYRIILRDQKLRFEQLYQIMEN